MLNSCHGVSYFPPVWNILHLVQPSCPAPSPASLSSLASMSFLSHSPCPASLLVQPLCPGSFPSSLPSFFDCSGYGTCISKHFPTNFFIQLPAFLPSLLLHLPCLFSNLFAQPPCPSCPVSLSSQPPRLSNLFVMPPSPASLPSFFDCSGYGTCISKHFPTNPPTLVYQGSRA